MHSDFKPETPQDKQPAKQDSKDTADLADLVRQTQGKGDRQQAITQEQQRVKDLGKTGLHDVKIDGAAPEKAQARGSKEAAADGKAPAKLPEVQLSGSENKKPPAEQPIDHNALEKDAEAIRKATGNDNWVARWADREAINNILKDKSEAERKVIDQFYQKKYGISLEGEMRKFESGADLEKFLNILHRKDKDVESQHVSRIREGLLERNNIWEGRSNSQIERDIRDTLSMHNSEQLGKMDKEYRQRYGVGLKDAIMKDPNLSQETKDACAIYLKGTDKRTDKDTLKLADIAIRAEDLTMFQEAMRDASPAARQQFMAADGAKRLDETFDHWYSSKELRHALDYAKEGKLDAATQVRDNTGVISDNTKGIELAINNMSAEQRSMYLHGQQLSRGEKLDNLTPEDKQKSRDYYKEMHAALKGAGNESEVKRWEDMIANKGGTLVSRLAEHRGTIYNDGAPAVLTSIENMSKKDWEYFNDKDPARRGERRDELKQMLETLKGARIDQSDVDGMMKVFDQKMAAKSFEESEASGRRSVVQALDDNVHWYSNDRKSMIEAISHMTPDEQKAYRENPDFRKQLDDKIKETIKDGTGLDAARHMLDKVLAGDKPAENIVTKLSAHALDFNVDEAQVIRDIQQAFKDDPSLREKIVNPKNAEEQKLAQDFNKAVRAALDNDEYQRYAKPLIETGHLPVELQMELNKGVFNDDEENAFKDIVNASDSEKARLKTDEAYREKVMGFLNDDEREIADNVIEQGTMRPEDSIRGNIIGFGGSSDIVQTLKDVKPEELDKLKSEYARKYGSSFEGDLLDKLSGQDKVEALRVLRSNRHGIEALDDARSELYSTNSGFGAWFVESVGRSATVSQADNAVHQYHKEVTEATKHFGAITEERDRELRQQCQETINNLTESKGAAGQYVVDGAVAVAGVASVVLSGGLSTPLVVGLVVAGSAAEVAGKKAFLGANYELTFLGAAGDAGIGALKMGTSLIGPGQVAAIFKVGETAAVQAAKATVKQIGEQGVKEMLKAGGEEALETSTKELIRGALVSGAKNIDKNAVLKVAEDVVSKELTGEAREQAVKQVYSSLQSSLNESLQKETENYLTNMARRGFLEGGGSALGGGAGGLGHGVTEWDPKKSVEENLKMVAESTVLSAGTAVVMTSIMLSGSRVISETYSSVKGAVRGEAPRFSPDAEVRVNGQKVESLQQGKMTTLGRGNFEGAPPEVSANHLSLARDENGQLLVMDHSNSGTFIKRAGADEFERIPAGKPAAVSPGDEVRLGSAEGAKLELMQVKLDAADAGPRDDLLWSPKRDLSKLSAAERQAIAEELKGRVTDLVQNQPIDDFITRSVKATSGWSDDLAKVAKRIDDVREPYEKAIKKYQDEVIGDFGSRVRSDDLQNREAVMAALQDMVHDGELTPDAALAKLAIFDDYMKYREPWAMNVMKLNQVLDERTDQLEKMINEFADAQGMPRVKVVVREDMGAALAQYDNGTIILRKPALYNTKDLGGLIESMYHEFTHSEQDSMIIRSIIDHVEKSRGAPITKIGPEELERIQLLYKGKANRNLSPEHLDNVLEARNGRVLTPEQAARAEDLAQAFKNNSPVGPQYVESGNHFRMAKRELKGLEDPEDPNGVYKLLTKLSRDKGTLSEHLFGSKTPPPEVQKMISRLKAFDRNDVEDFPKREYEATLKQLLKDRMKGLNDSRKVAYDKYMDGLHEKEAWVVGERARLRAEKQGVTKGSSQDPLEYEIGAPEPVELSAMQNFNPSAGAEQLSSTVARLPALEATHAVDNLSRVTTRSLKSATKSALKANFEDHGTFDPESGSSIDLTDVIPGRSGEWTVAGQVDDAFRKEPNRFVILEQGGGEAAAATSREVDYDFVRTRLERMDIDGKPYYVDKETGAFGLLGRLDGTMVFYEVPNMVAVPRLRLAAGTTDVAAAGSH